MFVSTKVIPRGFTGNDGVSPIERYSMSSRQSLLQPATRPGRRLDMEGARATHIM